MNKALTKLLSELDSLISDHSLCKEDYGCTLCEEFTDLVKDYRKSYSKELMEEEQNANQT